MGPENLVKGPGNFIVPPTFHLYFNPRVSLTFDGCIVNVAMATELGASLCMPHVNPIFQHPPDNNISVCILLDAYHMLKLMHNALTQKGVLLSPVVMK